MAENEKGRERTGGVALRTLAAAAVAAAGAPALFTAYRLIDGFDENALALSSFLPLILAALFIAFFLIQGAAAGLLASAFEKRPFSLLPHLSAPAVFGASMALGGAILGRWALPETILTVVFYVAGFLLYRARSKKYPKKTCVLFAATPTTALSVLVFALRAIARCGFADSPLQRYYGFLESTAQVIGRNMAKFLQALAGVNAEALIRQTLSSEVLQTRTIDESYALLGDVYAETFAAILKILPALTVALICVSGYISASACNRSSLFRREKPEWRLTASGVGMALFMISTVATTFFVSLSNAGAAGLFFYSMRLIFLPVFFGIGVGTLCSVKKEQISRHIVLTVICVLLILFSPFVTVPFIGVYGNTLRKREDYIRVNGAPPEL